MCLRAVLEYRQSDAQPATVLGTHFLLGEVIDQPGVLVAASCEGIIVGEVDDVSWADVHTVPQGAVGATQGRGHWVAGNVGLELHPAGHSCLVGGG